MFDEDYTFRVYYNQVGDIHACSSESKPDESLNDIPFLETTEYEYRDVIAAQQNYGVISINDVPTLVAATTDEYKAFRRKFDKQNITLIPVIDKQREHYVVKFTYMKNRNKVLVEGMDDFYKRAGNRDAVVWVFVVPRNYIYEPPLLTLKWIGGDVVMNKELYEIPAGVNQEITLISNIDKHLTSFEVRK